jgi:hypothetical protein
MAAKAPRPTVTPLRPSVDLLDGPLALRPDRPASLTMQLRANKEQDRQALARLVGEATITGQALLFDHANGTLARHLDRATHMTRAYADSLTPHELAQIELLREYFVTSVSNATVLTIDKLQELLARLEIPPAQVKAWEVALAAVLTRLRER